MKVNEKKITIIASVELLPEERELLADILKSVKLFMEDSFTDTPYTIKEYVDMLELLSNKGIIENDTY